ncbi:MAG: ATP12 family protein [Pseudomonadota bacterium]
MTAGSNGERPASDSPGVKRFYQAASIRAAKGGFEVTLDGKPVRTPAGSALLSAEAVASAIAAEWAEQGERILPETMPLTRIANTAIDGVARSAGGVVDDIVAIGCNDLLVYRADAPAGLVARQAAHWDPILAFIARVLGVEVRPTTGIMPVAQPDGLAPALRQIMPSDPLALTALHQLTTLTGSAFISVSVAAEHLTFDAAWTAAHVDEDWNIHEWGEDAEAAERRRRRAVDASAAAFLLSALRPALAR